MWSPSKATSGLASLPSKQQQRRQHSSPLPHTAGGALSHPWARPIHPYPRRLCPWRAHSCEWCAAAVSSTVGLVLLWEPVGRACACPRGDQATDMHSLVQAAHRVRLARLRGAGKASAPAAPAGSPPAAAAGLPLPLPLPLPRVWRILAARGPSEELAGNK